MSEIITFPLPDGANYVIPDIGDENWGQNVTDFLVALPNGVLPRSGTYAFTGDVTITGFGFALPYLKTSVINPATAGFVRLAKTDAIEWRNNANGANLSLAINGSDQLTFNGSPVTVGGVTSITGTANQITASASTGAVTLSIPSALTLSGDSSLTASSSGSLTLTGNPIITSGLVRPAIDSTYNIGSSNFRFSSIFLKNINIYDSTTNSISLQVPGSVISYTLLLPSSQGGAGTFLQNNGSGTLTWAAPSGSGTVNSGTAGNFSYYAASTNAVSDSGVSITSPSFSGTVLVGAATNQLRFTNNGGGNQIRTINVAPTTTVGEVITIPDSGGSDTVALLGATQTFTAATTLNNLRGTFGADVSAGSHKLTSLAAPTATGDALSQGNAISGTTGTFSGQVLASNGSAANPSYAFSSDPNTGWALPNSHETACYSNGTLAIDVKTDASVMIRGTTTNNNASAGFVGEYISSYASSTVSSTGSGNYFDITSIALTAGDWDVSGIVSFRNGAATISKNDAGISSTAGNSSAGLNSGDNYAEATPTNSTNNTSAVIPVVRVSIASPTTYYLKAFMTFTGSGAAALGRISARRVR